MGILTDESWAKPVLALIDTSGSVSDEVIESQLLFALSFAGEAGGLVGFFDTEMRSELMPLTPQTVGRLIAADGFPGRGGTDLIAVKEAMESLPQGRGPMRLAVLSDWAFGMPKDREEFSLSEGDEMFMMGDCLPPGQSQTESLLDIHKNQGVIAPWVNAWGSQEALAFASQLEAQQIAKTTRRGSKAERPSLAL